MRRRQFITLLGGAATWPVAARAQQPAMPVIGFLNGASERAFASRLRAFREGLREKGYVEGRNLAIEYRWANGNYDQLPALAADLVRRGVRVIATTGTTETLVAKAATATTPIVFTIAADPVALGLVVALNRPGGNLTGGTVLAVEVGPKKLELLHELVPATTVVALLINPTNPNSEAQTKDLRAAAGAIGMQAHLLRASTEGDLDAAFATMARLQLGALVIGTDPFFTSRSEQLAALSVRHSMPTIFQYRDFAAAGGLMSYGGSFTEGYRLVGVYAARIMGGEKPYDLPVQQYSKLELIINLRTAKALGIEVPPTLLARADEVIE